jgi:integrating conjugative element protein (TIGR03761 family)
MSQSPDSFDSVELSFTINPKSPFPDRYDLAAEQALVASFRSMASFEELDPLNPLYPRLMEVMRRETMFAEMQLQNRVHRGADESIPLTTARKVDSIGALRSMGENIMSLHTREAFWLYTGRRRDPANEANPYGIPGATRCASEVRQLFFLSGNNNPYADLALLDFEEKIHSLRQVVAATEKKFQQHMEDVAKRGLVLSVMGAEQPASVSLTYRSPYGFTISLLLVELDYCFRVIESCKNRDLCTSQIAHAAILTLKRAARRLFAETARYTRVLSQKDMLPLSRHDFILASAATNQSKATAPALTEASSNAATSFNAELNSKRVSTADRDLALKRIAAATSLLGECPLDILSMERLPRHSGRIASSSAKQQGQDKVLLRQLASTGFSLQELQAQIEASQIQDVDQERVEKLAAGLIGEVEETGVLTSSSALNEAASSGKSKSGEVKVAVKRKKDGANNEPKAQ